MKLVDLFGFIIKKFVTMHGYMNVKFISTTVLVNIQHRQGCIVNLYSPVYEIKFRFNCTVRVSQR